MLTQLSFRTVYHTSIWPCPWRWRRPITKRRRRRQSGSVNSLGWVSLTFEWSLVWEGGGVTNHSRRPHCPRRLASPLQLISCGSHFQPEQMHSGVHRNVGGNLWALYSNGLVEQLLDIYFHTSNPFFTNTKLSSLGKQMLRWCNESNFNIANFSNIKLITILREVALAWAGGQYSQTRQKFKKELLRKNKQNL